MPLTNRSTLSPGCEGKVLKDRLQEAVRDGVSVFHGDLVPARLTVDADANLDLIFRELKARRPGVRNRAAGQGYTHGPHIGHHALGDGRDRVKIVATLGGCTCDLFHKDSSANAAPASRVQRVLHGDVVVHQHRTYVNAFGLSHFGGGFEVQYIAGVVFHDMDDAGA